MGNSGFHGDHAKHLHNLLAGNVSFEEVGESFAARFRKFAREHLHLWGIMVTPCTPCPEDAAAHGELWEFVVSQVALLASHQYAREAAVAL
jgi:hypothetical protein